MSAREVAFARRARRFAQTKANEKIMDVDQAVSERISVRAFTKDPVPEETVRELLTDAARAPSGGNLQPWRVHVVMGAARDRLIRDAKAAIAANPMGDESELAIYPKGLPDPWRARRFALGEAMYEKLGIPREDKPARLQWLLNNFDFFGAPVGLFFSLDRQFDRGQWAHLGMFMQTIALLAVARGLGTCMQEAWQTRAKTVSEFLGLEPQEQFYCGMALGFPDREAPVNELRSERAGIDAFARFLTS